MRSRRVLTVERDGFVWAVTVAGVQDVGSRRNPVARPAKRVGVGEVLEQIRGPDSLVRVELVLGVNGAAPRSRAVAADELDVGSDRGVAMAAARADGSGQGFLGTDADVGAREGL